MTTFLIIDDSPTIRATLRKMLEAIEATDLEVLDAESGDQAAPLFARADVIFLDIHLRQEDGSMILRRILQKRPLAKVVLVTSALRNDERVIDALSQGAFAYIEKPIRRDSVLQVLRELKQESSAVRRI